MVTILHIDATVNLMFTRFSVEISGYLITLYFFQQAPIILLNMIRGIYTSAAGMLGRQTAMDAIANNLANANTTGFKADGFVFGELMEQAISRVKGETAQTIGSMSSGSSPSAGYTDFSNGAVTFTGNFLNAAFLTEGFFSVQTPNGIRYTRDGSFNKSADGTLITSNGHAVLNAEGKPINVGSGKPAISENGTIMIDGKPADRLMIVSGSNMKKIGSNLFEGNVQPLSSFRLEPGALESSNINVVASMVQMIETMRAYEANQRVLTAQDETLGKAVNEIARF